jgi:hypothetical protein
MKSRGMKNNNPFNIIETDTTWLGEVRDKDLKFEGFSDLKYGLRAGLINLYNVYFSKGLTLRQLLAKYAPAADNNNEKAYLDAVVRRTGVIPEQVPIKSKWLDISSAILYHENGFQVKTPDELREVVLEFKLIQY